MPSNNRNWNLIDWVLWLAMWVVIVVFGVLSVTHFLGVQVQAALISSTAPNDPENWIEVSTSQTPTDAINWWVRPKDKPPLHIIEQPVFWVYSGPTTIHIPIEFRVGGEESKPPMYVLQLNLLQSEFALDEIAINIGEHNGTGHPVTVTSTLGQRTVVRPALSIPEPQTWLLITLMAVLLFILSTPPKRRRK